MMQARLLSRAVVLVVTGLVAGVGWAGEIDVVSRGAKGDGVADDTAAFVAAFKAGLDVYVPAGTYLIDDLTLPENGYLHGAGRASTILLKSGEGAIRPGSGCRISNLHFTGQDAFDAKPAGNQGKALINIPQGHNITIDHVRIDNYRFTGLHTDHVTDLRITNKPRFDLTEFWSNAGVSHSVGADESRSATVRAIEGARTPDELLEMLEGADDLLDDVPRGAFEDRRDGRMRWVAVVLAALLATAAVTYAVFPQVFDFGAPQPAATAPPTP